MKHLEIVPAQVHSPQSYVYLGSSEGSEELGPRQSTSVASVIGHPYSRYFPRLS